jgi:transcriptional regulator with XRE-family HTH domain
MAAILVRPNAAKDRITMNDDKFSIVQIGERLRLLRETLQYSQTEFARKLNISLQTWNNYERGVSRIRVDEAYKLVQQTGVTLDWIYLGTESHLPKALSEKLDMMRRLKQDRA